ncbi:MAG: hydrogenase formation protein HypD [Candidatus Aminicenantales bacterium]
MKELRNPAALRSLLSDIEEKSRKIGRTPRLMEVCGTHTMALFKSGLTPLLAEAGVEMVSGPGCPVCITPNAIHEAAIAIVTGTEGVTLATFGDMTRVPTRKGSLQTAVPARASRMRIVYSPEEALNEARRDPARKVVFYGAGFETTIPAIAYTVRQAAAEGLRNYSVLPALWLVPPALRAILEAGEAAVDGFIYPGHVSAVIGAEPYEFVAREFGVPGAIAGFEPGDILLAIRSVLEQAVEGKPRVALEYSRAIGREGNPVARALMDEVLEPFDASWRGLGVIPASGLRFRKEFAAFGAGPRFGLKESGDDRDLAGCRCGEVLRGVIRPEGCRLFGTKCLPDSPLGPCMVSYEGACLIHFKYGGERRARS